MNIKETINEFKESFIMNILIATFWVSPHVGGVWNYMKQLKENLELLGHNVDLFAYGKDHEFVHLINKNKRIDKKQFSNVIEQNFPTTVVDWVVHYYQKLQFFYELGARSLIDFKDYDLIHTQDVFSTIAFNRIRSNDTALVATLHGSVAEEIKEAHYNVKEPDKFVSWDGKTYFEQLETTAATAPELTIVANKWLKNLLINAYHVPPHQLQVLHYGYDIESFLQKMLDKSNIIPPANKKIIIYTGRLVESKGVHHLINALHQLKKIRRDWVCWIVGDGPKRNEFQNLVEKLGLQNHLIFLGKRDDIPYLLSISDLFILPTLMDNQPLSIIEAQIAGKAIIASNVGGIPEMIQDRLTGLLFPPGDVESLVNHINYLFNHENVRLNLGQRAQKWALKHWSIQRATQKVLNVYQTAIKKRNKS